MSYKNIDDGFASYLVKDAKFTGKYQIPILSKHDSFFIPKDMIPFDKRKRIKNKDVAICFYIHDIAFKQILKSTNRYIDELKQFLCVISPDCSLYRDMPLCLQIVNTYRNRAVAHYLSENGIYVIPNVRWGDERSFEFCFDGLPKNDIVCISTYGCIKSSDNKYYFKLGLKEMLRVLSPQIVLVYGAMPSEVFNDFIDQTKFVHYQNYISKVKGGNNNG